MKCKKCQESFPNRIMIDGKYRILNSRKYCFNCSPFGKHNTKKIHMYSGLGQKAPILHTCFQCGKLFNGGHGKSSKVCGSCKVTNFRIKHKKKLLESFGGKCIVCGYDKCQNALEFHHKDPKQKKMSISGSTKSKNTIKNETKKCILVCCRCHREIHAGFIDTNLFIPA